MLRTKDGKYIILNMPNPRWSPKPSNQVDKWLRVIMEVAGVGFFQDIDSETHGVHENCHAMVMYKGDNFYVAETVPEIFSGLDLHLEDKKAEPVA